MMAILVWWFALPTIARRLLGAGAILVVVASTVTLVLRHERNVGYARGYRRAADSVWVVAIRQRQIVQDSLEAKADSAHQDVITQTNKLALVRDSLDAKLARRPTGLRLEPLPDSFSRVPTADKVRVIVESTGDTINDVPRQAAVYWFRTDSLLGEAKRLLDKYAAANKQWASAWEDEHNARIGADSLTQQWRARALSVQPEPNQHGRMASVWKWTERTLLLGGGIYLGRRLR